MKQSENQFWKESKGLFEKLKGVVNLKDAKCILDQIEKVFDYWKEEDSAFNERGNHLLELIKELDRSWEETLKHFDIMSEAERTAATSSFKSDRDRAVQMYEELEHEHAHANGYRQIILNGFFTFLGFILATALMSLSGGKGPIQMQKRSAR